MSGADVSEDVDDERALHPVRKAMLTRSRAMTRMMGRVEGEDAFIVSRGPVRGDETCGIQYISLFVRDTARYPPRR
jgi:hypothetical protein